MNTGFPLDLVALVPGKDEQETLEGLLSERRESLQIRTVRREILVHPRLDPGCFHEAPAVLQSYQDRAARALVLFDHEGSGQEDRSAGALAHEVESRLSESGWEDRACVLVVQPELEAWVWSDSPEVDAVLGWGGHIPQLRPWLAAQGFWPQGQAKPLRPKESFLAALREVHTRRSSAIFRQLAEKVGLERCQDRTFAELKKILKSWFPSSSDGV
ncbi:MAG: hypothetical protein HYW07_22680 [Candidatus Latescibacteria bacterium]|nr:hypothetical protein [Candidatus Latescibacterota bacterium]